MKLPLIAVGVVVAFILSGCTAAIGTDPASTAANTSTASPAASAPPSEPPAATASPYVSDPPSKYTLSDGQETQVSWLSPSRNIACGIVLTGQFASLWGCTVDDHTWVAPSANSGDICYNAGDACGSGIEALGSGALRGRGIVVFESQRAIDGGVPPTATIQTLAYGHSVTADGVTCASLATGMTCSNAASGHGFTLSKSTYSTH